MTSSPTCLIAHSKLKEPPPRPLTPTPHGPSLTPHTHTSPALTAPLLTPTQHHTCMFSSHIVSSLPHCHTQHPHPHAITSHILLHRAACTSPLSPLPSPLSPLPSHLTPPAVAAGTSPPWPSASSSVPWSRCPRTTRTPPEQQG